MPKADARTPPATTGPKPGIAKAPIPMRNPVSPPSSPPPSAPAPDAPLVEGTLEDGSGAALLMGLFAQDVSGRLELTGGRGAGTLHFVRGEPSWAIPPDGDVGLYQRMIKSKLVHHNLPQPQVPEQHVVARLGRGVLVHVELEESHALVLVGHVRQDRPDDAARPAPRRPEVDDDGTLRPEDGGFEVRVPHLR